MRSFHLWPNVFNTTLPNLLSSRNNKLGRWIEYDGSVDLAPPVDIQFRSYTFDVVDSMWTGAMIKVEN